MIIPRLLSHLHGEWWDCKLFLNYKTVDRADEESVINKVSAYARAESPGHDGLSLILDVKQHENHEKILPRYP